MQRLMTMQEAAEYLSRPLSACYDLVRRGDLEAVAMPGRGRRRVYRVRPEALDAYIRRCTVNASPDDAAGRQEEQRG